MGSLDGYDAKRIRSLLMPVAQNGICGPESACLLDVGTQGYLAYFAKEVLRGLAATGGATVRVFEGAYGAGKTHLLRLLENLGREHSFASVFTQLNNHALQIEDWRAVTAYILGNLEMDIEGQRARSMPAILSRLASCGKADLKQLQQTVVSHAPYKTAMEIMVNPAKRIRVKCDPLELFLSGERVRVADLREAGIQGVKNPLSNRNCEQVLHTALTGLHALTGRGILLLFDETDRAFSKYETRRVHVAANLMRRFIDACLTGQLPGTVAVFAVLQDFVQTCGLAYPALGQRLHTDGLDGAAASWRTPVLPLERINELEDEGEFLNAAVGRCWEILVHLGRGGEQCRVVLSEVGTEAVEAQAGSGYRRALMKALALKTLQLLQN
jgi:hypothetical protein